MANYVPYKSVSMGGKVSPLKLGYHLVPVYQTPFSSDKHKNNKIWIEESLTGTWSCFAFGAHPKPGITYCFKSKIDAGMFTFCRCALEDGLKVG